jgi:hypothetical protein
MIQNVSWLIGEFVDIALLLSTFVMPKITETHMTDYIKSYSCSHICNISEIVCFCLSQLTMSGKLTDKPNILRDVQHQSMISLVLANEKPIIRLI